MMMCCVPSILEATDIWPMERESLLLAKQLQTGYPDYIQAIETDNYGSTWILLHSGERFLFDDKRSKTLNETLNAPDLQDMLAQPYCIGAVLAAPQPGEHPGRVRVEAFFQAVYGKNRKAVEANLVPVVFLGKTVSFNVQNHAAEALSRVSEELSALLVTHPAYKRYILPVNGTMAWRTIAGTKRLSTHSFGIAIDLAAQHNGYWRYRGRPGAVLDERQAFPQEVVDIFERNGFIWGGKWWEYDFMHFEYRPELVIMQERCEPNDNG